MKDIFESSPDVLIAEAKGSFNKLFRTSDYQKIIADDDQLKKLIDLLNVKSHCAYLDLATGTGYVGFALAERYPECLVVGLDIANEVINENLTQVKERDLSNIEFRIYDGITFPDFETNFDGVICRYALHHFPKVHETLDDISRVWTAPHRLDKMC
jgi:ubiquinone/menaquinone biosynthesis C-methylase UbiE